MSQPQTQTVNCPSCGQPFQATLRRVIDAQQDPEGKSQLISGNLNTIRCPHCGATSRVATPILYHDADNELLVSFIPMELNLGKEEQDKLVGSMMNELTAQIPQEQFKGYMFQPKSALTMQGLIDQVLQAEGISSEQIQEQRDRVQLAQKFIDSNPEQLPSLVQQHDDDIDDAFFQTLTLIAQRMLEDGRQDLAQHVVYIQNQIAQLSSYGQEMVQQQQQQEQVVQEVTETLQSLGDDAQRSDFIDLAADYADQDMHLQALVGLARPAFDEGFFNEFEERIAQAPAADRDDLQDVRDRISDLTSQIDQQQQQVVQRAASLLQAIVNSPNPEELIAQNLQLIDDTFMAVLQANIQQALKSGNSALHNRLQEIEQKVISTLQSQMQPELRFLNDLLSEESDEQVRHMINDKAQEFGSDLLDVINAVQQMLQQQGNNRGALDRLDFIRKETMRALSA